MSETIRTIERAPSLNELEKRHPGTSVTGLLAMQSELLAVYRADMTEALGLQDSEPRVSLGDLGNTAIYSLMEAKGVEFAPFGSIDT